MSLVVALRTVFHSEYGLRIQSLVTRKESLTLTVEFTDKDNIRGQGSSMSLKLMDSFIQFLALKVKSLVMA